MATRGWSVSSDSSDDELPTLSKLVSTAAKAVVVLSDSSDGSERGDMLESRLLHASKNNTQTAEHCGNSKNAVRVKSKPQIQTSSLAERDTNGTYCRNKGKSKTAPLNKSEKRRKVEKPKPASVQPKARLLKPEECLEQVICCIDSKLNAMFEFETLFEKLRDFTELKAVNFEVMDADVLSVVWRRCSGQTTAGKISVAHNDGAGKNAVFVVLPAREYAKLVCAQEADDVYEVPPRKTCGEWVSDVTSLYKNCKIHAVCLGLQTYLREAKTKNKRRAQQNGNSKRVNSKRSTFMPVVSALEQDLAHAETQLLADIDWVFAETAADLCSVIAQYTKSFAQAPQKLLTENDRFVKDTEAVKINLSTGEGLRHTWRQMLLAIHDMGPETTDAIAEAFPSHNSLIRAYQQRERCQADLLLAEIPVRRGEGVLARERRIGPEMSKRLHRLFTSENYSDPLG